MLFDFFSNYSAQKDTCIQHRIIYLNLLRHFVLLIFDRPPQKVSKFTKITLQIDYWVCFCKFEGANGLLQTVSLIIFYNQGHMNYH